MHACAPNGAAMIYTTRTLSAKACFKAAVPAEMICGVTPGSFMTESELVPVKAPTKAGMLLSRRVLRAAEKMAVKVVAPTARADVVTAVGVAIKWCGVDSCTPGDYEPERGAEAKTGKSIEDDGAGRVSGLDGRHAN
ncbi:hypothetical protein B0A50_08559 [Salinomyces thailandicus]|uniref:Uncharacterized protein n=1 Tax=Salinomyces thailandicus TaxID=706561 RepID=A0A4U0TJH6_9PEZI|nr:hypothetical protein B0A50_08559 [Salinomyces thailandica]